MGDKKRTAAMDLVFGVALVVFGIYVIISSLGMKYMHSFIDGAGFFPLIIGCVLTVLGALLAFTGIKLGGLKELKEVCTAKFVVDFFKNDGTIRVLILLAMMIIYMYVLIGLIGFNYATMIYLFCNFMYLQAFKKVGPIPGWVIALIVSVALPFVVYYAFKMGLGVTLP